MKYLFRSQLTVENFSSRILKSHKKAISRNKYETLKFHMRNNSITKIDENIKVKCLNQ